jgi:hypothetical protein
MSAATDAVYKAVALLPIERAALGMRLARDVLDINGRRLLAAGTELSAGNLGSLRQRGIRVLAVEQLLSPDSAAERRAAISARLDARFREVAHDPLMQELKQALLAHRLTMFK